MKFLILAAQILTLGASNTSAQGILIRYDSGQIVFNMTDGDTLAAVNSFTYKYYLNDSILVIPTVCTGTSKPWTCAAPAPQWRIGNNILYVSWTPALINGVINGVESPKAGPLILFFAAVQLTNQCKPGTYKVDRITDATKLAGILNSISTFVSNIMATSNAIYVFSCSPLGG